MASADQVELQKSKYDFRVIVVGCGVTGLVASHCLAQAGINHVVLEKGAEAAPAQGSSIAIYPHGARILQQLGLLEQTDAIADPLEDGATDRWPDGSAANWSDIWRFVHENHGHELLLLERREYLQMLFNNLPDKSRILFNKKVTDIVEDYNGVEVFTSDGKSEKGDVVIGCDGVHSHVREAMWARANQVEPGLIPHSEKLAIKATWQCLLGFGPGEPHMRNELSVVMNRGHSFLLGTQARRVFFFAFKKIEKPYSRYSRRRYKPEDTEALAETFADQPVSESMLFGELWRKKYRGQLVDIEEGMLEQWHYGRLVLAGDSAHKITPNMALGGNSGMESIVVLTNQLHRLLEAHQGAKPSRATLSKCFRTYQEIRKPRMRRIKDFSGLITRIQAWDTTIHKFLAMYVVPRLPSRMLADRLGDIIREAPKLDFVPLGPWPETRIAWADEIQQRPSLGKSGQGGKDNSARNSETISSLAVSLIGSVAMCGVLIYALS